jgi:hypothetical protein
MAKPIQRLFESKLYITVLREAYLSLPEQEGELKIIVSKIQGRFLPNNPLFSPIRGGG